MSRQRKENTDVKCHLSNGAVSLINHAAWELTQREERAGEKWAGAYLFMRGAVRKIGVSTAQEDGRAVQEGKGRSARQTVRKTGEQDSRKLVKKGKTQGGVSR